MMPPRLRRAAARLCCGVLSLGFALGLAGCGMRSRYSATWWDVFDTVTTVTGYATGQSAWDSAAEAVHARLMRYHQLFDIYNTYDGINNLATVNANAGVAPVRVEPEMIELLTLAKQMYQTTQGRCNVAAGAVLNLWHDAREAGIADPANAALPDAAALAAAAAHCDINDLILDETAGTVYLADAQMRLDVGAIAKGFATEAAAVYAQSIGLTSALLNVGGDLRAIGEKPGGQAWTAGIESPWPDAQGSYNTADYVLAITLADGQCAVTSGDYQRYYTVNGTRYAHLIDPETLYPARFMSAVTVICGDSGVGDALSTGLFCMSIADGQALLAGMPGTEAVWLSADGTITKTPGFSALEKQG